MKYLVCISKVADTTTKISFKNGNKELDISGVTYIINPTDEWYALVRALELKEQYGGIVTVINVGNADNEQLLRKALAIGADDAVLIKSSEEMESYSIAKNISKYAKAHGYECIITGKETISYNSFCVGGMISEFMDWDFVSQVTKWESDNDKATINREIEGGEEILEVKYPLVLSAQKGISEQRLPNMRGIMSAKTKPMTIIEGEEEPMMVSIESYSEPKIKSAVKLYEIGEIEKLVEALNKEAKVI